MNTKMKNLECSMCGEKLDKNDLLSDDEIDHIAALLKKEDQAKTYPDKRNMMILRKILKLNKTLK